MVDLGTLPDAGGHGVWASTYMGLELFLSLNNLTGTVPGSWSHLNLTKLSISDNRLAGTLPAEWGLNNSFPSLISIFLQRNRLEGVTLA